MTTAVVCGAAVLLLPWPCDAAVASDAEPGVTAAPDATSPRQAPADSTFAGGATLSDPDPTDEDGDDDDDGDAAPDAPATAANAATPIADSGEHAVMTTDPVLRPLAPLDGHSLRGPPSVSPDNDCTDVDDDDDDDDASDSSPRREFQRQLQPVISFASHTEPARRHVHDGPQLRAP